MTRFHLPALSLEVVDGEIAAQDVDCVVNAANNALWMGSGVAGAIKARGGVEIETEAMAQAPIEPGASVVTGAGGLTARHVIHAVVMGQDLQTSAALIGRATRSAFVAADARGLKSVALPAFGTGAGGFPLDDCARIMLGGVRAFAPTAESVKVVRFVLFGRPQRETLERVVRDIIGGPERAALQE